MPCLLYNLADQELETGGWKFSVLLAGKPRMEFLARRPTTQRQLPFLLPIMRVHKHDLTLKYRWFSDIESINLLLF